MLDQMDEKVQRTVVRRYVPRTRHSADPRAVARVDPRADQMAG